ncbi:MAG: hypothetical protein FJ224_04860 [Lentisphaerae bacterium]|nr:hypothetical protein [Lentisphaerota bacterium]
MSQIENLLSLQETDCRIRELERLQSDIPARKALEESRLDGHRAAVKAAEDYLKTKQAAVKDIEVDAGCLREKIKKLRMQQMDLKTNKEFKAIQDEISGIEAQINGLEDRELVLMQETEEAKTSVENSRSSLASEEAVIRKDIHTWEAKLVEIESEISKFKAEREQKAALIDPVWLSTYRTIFSRRDLALVPIEDGVCGGCHMKVPRFVVHDARKQAEMVKCSYCGRLVY